QRKALSESHRLSAHQSGRAAYVELTLTICRRGIGVFSWQVAPVEFREFFEPVANFIRQRFLLKAPSPVARCAVRQIHARLMPATEHVLQGHERRVSDRREDCANEVPMNLAPRSMQIFETEIALAFDLRCVARRACAGF